MTDADVLYESVIPGLPLLGRGKVRDIYGIDDEHLLIVTTDRLSAYDVVLPDPVPGKGTVLNRLSQFWFHRMADLVDNQLTTITVDEVVSDPALREQLRPRSLVVKRLRPLPIEAVVRGYLIGSGWRDYQRCGQTSGVQLPAGLQQAARLHAPVFAPASKADAGEHDENIGFDEVAARVGRSLAERVRDVALAIYTRASEHARERGIIVADTKFEFGTDAEGRLHLIDEVLTPDSSRFWPANDYRPGTSPPSFDKQYVRDYLDTLDWDRTAPGPTLPAEVIARTRAKYEEALRILTAA